jgi:hypothetical protein
MSDIPEIAMVCCLCAITLMAVVFVSVFLVEVIRGWRKP